MQPSERSSKIWYHFSLLKIFHWLPIALRIKYKHLIMAFHDLTATSTTQHWLICTQYHGLLAAPQIHGVSSQLPSLHSLVFWPRLLFVRLRHGWFLLISQVSAQILPPPTDLPSPAHLQQSPANCFHSTPVCFPVIYQWRIITHSNYFTHLFTCLLSAIPLGYKLPKAKSLVRLVHGNATST